MKSFVVIAIVVLNTMSVMAKDPPRRCIDGMTSVFVESAAVPTNQLSEKLPVVEYPPGVIEPDDPKALGKMTWEKLPADTKVEVARIADYRGHSIYRATYEWSEEGVPYRCILLAYCDMTVATTRPFFVAGSEELSNVEAWVTSTKTEPFGLEVRIDWKGNGVMWASFDYAFDPVGPRLLTRTSGGRHQHAKTRRF